MEFKRRLPELVPLKSTCCGCGVCKLLCPQNAIEISCDREGFLYPIIDEKKCIGCNICLQNCAIKVRRTDVQKTN
nr:(Fe-S)-binding protein [uncultured Acetatifactor sp.]